MTSIPSFMFSDVVDDAGFHLMFLTFRRVKTCVCVGGQANVSICVQLCFRALFNYAKVFMIPFITWSGR